jgi:HSP20 family molecular chaperone IbpA
MPRIPFLSSPLLLGFEEMERMMDRVAKTSSEGYPPYNIERITAREGAAETLRITLAVAGFTREQLEITLEDNQLTVKGRQSEAPDGAERVFLHRGIAARQFQRTFLIADGIEVLSAGLDHGLLSIDLARPEQARIVRRIEIG